MLTGFNIFVLVIVVLAVLTLFAGVKTVPQGYTKDHPDIDLLRYKQFLVSHPLTEEMALSDDLIDHTITAFRLLTPFVTYIAEALEA